LIFSVALSFLRRKILWPKKKVIEVEGKVVETLPNATFKVELYIGTNSLGAKSVIPLFYVPGADQLPLRVS